MQVKFKRCSVADDIINDARDNLQQALSTTKTVDRNLTQQALSKIERCTERKRRFEKDLDEFVKKRNRLQKERRD